MKQGTQSPSTGTTQRDGMGKEVVGGTHVHWFMSVYGGNHHNIVISLQLK